MEILYSFLLSVLICHPRYVEYVSLHLFDVRYINLVPHIRPLSKKDSFISFTESVNWGKTQNYQMAKYKSLLNYKNELILNATRYLYQRDKICNRSFEFLALYHMRQTNRSDISYSSSPRSLHHQNKNLLKERN